MTNAIINRHPWNTCGEAHKYYLGDNVIYDYIEGNTVVSPKADEPSIMGIGLSIWSDDIENDTNVILTEDGALYYYSGTHRQKHHDRDLIINKRSNTYTKISINDFANEHNWRISEIIDFVALRCQLFK